MTPKKFARVDAALVEVIETPERFTKTQVDFARKAAERLGEWGERVFWSAYDEAILEGIEAVLREDAA